VHEVHENGSRFHGPTVIGGDMKEIAVHPARVSIATVVLLQVLLCESRLHAQIMSPPTIDSRDTRTMEDTRGQDPRQNPGPVPPSAIELMKRLNEGKAPDGAAESDSSKAQSDDTKAKDAKDAKPQASPPPGN
jgi:hypothetical protein